MRATSGERSAYTIDALCKQTGIGRRDMEELLQVRLNDFPFVVVSTGNGYFRPATADEINHCLKSLQGRAVNLFLRKRTIIQKARRSGWARDGKTFCRQVPVSDLFEAIS